MVEADKTGLVHDGGSMEFDEDFQTDITTISITFHGFSSAKHGIARYSWAIGTEPLSDNIMGYTEDDIVQDRDTLG